MKQRSCQWMFRAVVFLGVFSLFVSPVRAKEAIEPWKSFSRIIEEDWARQEKRKNRSMYDPAAIRELWQRTHQLLHDLQEMPNAADYRKEEAQLKQFQEQVTAIPLLSHH